jgi:hypothetical protein
VALTTFGMLLKSGSQYRGGAMVDTLQDDSIFVLEAIKDAAEASGMNPDSASFADFPTHTQSTILRKAAELKAEYRKQTEQV